MNRFVWRSLRTVALVLATSRAGEAQPASWREELQTWVKAAADTAYRAWLSKNPSLLIPGPESSVVVRHPNGTTVTAGEMRVDLLRRMSMITRLDTLSEVFESMRVVGDSVEVTTRQRFVRAVKVGDAPERVRVSSVGHRRWMRRVDGRWLVISPIQEFDQIAYWADEGPPRQPQNQDRSRTAVRA